LLLPTEGRRERVLAVVLEVVVVVAAVVVVAVAVTAALATVATAAATVTVAVAHRQAPYEGMRCFSAPPMQRIQNG
jgi:hypothetical protein